MSQRVAAIAIVIVAVILTILAFTQQQGAANNEATAIAKAYSAGTSQAKAEADQQTAIFQMDTHATAQSQAEATRAAAEVSAQQAAATAVAAVDQAVHQADLAETAQAGATQQAFQAETAQAGATQQALQAGTAQAGATQQAQIAAQAHTDATEQAITATAARREAIQLANTAEAFQAEVTAQSNQLATQQSLASAGAATAQKAQTQVNQLAARSTTEAVAIQQTLSVLEVQAAIPIAPQDVIQSLVRRKIIPENTGRLGARLGKTTIDMSGEFNRSDWNYLSGQYSDFVMSSEISWGSGSPTDQCDFIMRHMDNNNHYRVGITHSGQVHFDTYYDTEWDEREPYTNMFSLVRTEQADTNELLVVGVGDTFTVFINGEVAITYHDARLTKGQLAVEAATDFGERGAGCTFQNTWVWDLSAPAPIPAVQSTPFTVPSLDSQYTTKDGKLSVKYPDDWKATEVGSSTVLYSKGIKQFGATQIPTGEMTVVISVLSTRTDNPPNLDFTLQFLTSLFAGSLGEQQIPPTFSEPETFSLPGRTIRRVIASSTIADVQFWVYRDHGVTIGVVIGCAPGEGPLCEATAAAIVQTINYDTTGKNA